MTSYHGYLNGYFPIFAFAITYSEVINTQVSMVLPIQMRDRSSEIGSWNTGTQKLQPTLQPTLIHWYKIISAQPHSSL
jgi:hypothetical protein